MSYIYHTRANTYKEDTVFLVLCIELAYNNIHSGLGGGVQSTNLDIVLIGQFEVGQTG